MMKNQRVVVTRPGGPEVLELIEEDLPEPQAGQARVKILAAGVAYADVGVRWGTYPVPESSRRPVSPGYDIVGVVDALGSGVSEVSTGQPVAALTVVGGYARYLCLPASELVPVPDGLDPVQTVSLVLNYVTAYQMLQRVAAVQAGDWILVHGAAGGVGTALLDLGKLMDLKVIGTASSGKQDLVARLGAVAINYQAEDFVARVKQESGEGVASAYDPIGPENYVRSYQALRPGGILVTYGSYAANQGGRSRPQVAAATRAMREQLAEQHEDGKRVEGYFIAGMKAAHPDWFRSDLLALLDLLAQGKLHPLIAERLPLREARRAHQLMDHAGAMGKIVLIPQSDSYTQSMSDLHKEIWNGVDAQKYVEEERNSWDD
ncbi:MAG: medium chain dehydrogenase/reductase family protein [Anaerolineales bacterium]|jgi:NADPH:quinone reductase-like Zn-dependent oxidoreductase